MRLYLYRCNFLRLNQIYAHRKRYRSFINYELSDLTGQVMEKPDSPISYLHGGYDGIFPMVEEKLHSKEVGYSCSVLMEPENTFGEYDSELVRVESSQLFFPTMWRSGCNLKEVKKVPMMR